MANLPTLDIGSSPDGAAYKVPSTPKSGQKAAANPDDSKAVEVKKITPSSGFIATPGVERSENFTADYYRNGKPGEVLGAGIAADSSPPPARSILPFGIEKDYRGNKVASSIRLRGKDKKNKGKEVDYIPAYTKYILSSVQESYTERSQIIETFGESYIFLFGSRPSIFTFSGTLMNSVNVNWVQDFMFYYENYIRGTKAVDLRARVIMTYGGRQVEGYILGTNNNTAAITEEGVSFSFQLVVIKRNSLGFSEDFGIVKGADGSTVSDPNLRALIRQQAGEEGKGTSDPETSADHNALKRAVVGGPPASFNPNVA